MLCPKCKSDNLKIVESRPHGATTRRRRMCLDCEVRFNTLEIIDYEYDNLKGKANLLAILLKSVGDAAHNMEGGIDREQSENLRNE